MLFTQRSYYVINKCQNTPEETSFRNAAVVNTVGCLPVRPSFMLLHPCRQNPDFVQGSVFLRKIRSCVSEEDKSKPIMVVSSLLPLYSIGLDRASVSILANEMLQEVWLVAPSKVS